MGAELLLRCSFDPSSDRTIIWFVEPTVPSREITRLDAPADASGTVFAMWDDSRLICLEVQRSSEVLHPTLQTLLETDPSAAAVSIVVDYDPEVNAAWVHLTSGLEPGCDTYNMDGPENDPSLLLLSDWKDDRLIRLEIVGGADKILAPELL